MSAEPFWRAKALEELTTGEWESLCDGCGRCCLVKLEDEDTGRVYYTDVACRLLQAGTCRCSDYPRRAEKVSDCVRLTPETVRAITWLPPTCGYRLVAEGKDLPDWHPLVSGDPDTVRLAGVSMHGRTLASEEDVDVLDLPDHIVHWPTRRPKPLSSMPGKAARKAGSLYGRQKQIAAQSPTGALAEAEPPAIEPGEFCDD